MADTSPPSNTDYRVSVAPAKARVRARHDGKIIADSQRALLVKETAHPDVYYFPLNDISMESFVQTSHGSHCPLKGDAVYWTLKTDAGELENVLWSYPEPLDSVEQLRGHAAFYADRIAITVDEQK